MQIVSIGDNLHKITKPVFGRVSKKNLSFKIEMFGRVGIGRHPRFTFWLTFFQSYILTLFFSVLLSYLVGMKRRTNRHVMCKRDDSHFLHYVLITTDVQGLPLG